MKSARSLLLVTACAAALASPGAGCTVDNPNFIAGIDGGESSPDLSTIPEEDLASLPGPGDDLARVVDMAGPRDLATPSCGVAGKPCCNGQCQSGSICNFGTCAACGGAGQGCCNNQSCGSGLVCNFNQCQACGNLYQPCCAGQKCGLGATCSFGQCQPCGNANEMCCPGNNCGAGSVCQFGNCRACGQQFQPCCQNDVCGTNLVCAGIGIQSCMTCGGQGQPCCANNSCPRSNNHKCSNGTCN